MDHFEQSLEKLLSKRRQEMREHYNRVLPTGELLFNRFDKAKYLGMGDHSSVYDTSVIMGDISVGDNVWIGPFSLIEGINGRVTIGDYVSINAGVMIFCHDSTHYYVSGGVDNLIKGDVNIGSNTVIGSMSMVLPGVRVGKHCVIGANSVVTKDIPDYSIAAGTPAKIIGQVKIDFDGHAHFVYK